MSDGPIEALRTEVDQWIQTTGVRYFDPLTNLAMLTEEVGDCLLYTSPSPRD